LSGEKIAQSNAGQIQRGIGQSSTYLAKKCGNRRPAINTLVQTEISQV
jgi:hypothetical protein